MQNGRNSSAENRRLGVAVVGLGGAVATTAVAGVELLRQGLAGTEGLPLAEATQDGSGGGPDGLIPYENLYFAGWDLYGDDLHVAAGRAGVLEERQLEAAKEQLSGIRPWPAVGSREFCRNAGGENTVAVGGHREQVEAIRQDLRRFRRENALDSVVLANLASTERTGDLSSPVLSTIDAFERGLDGDSPEIGPAMIYAYAAIQEGVPYTNFTPSVSAEIPALIHLAGLRNVPVSGRDGKTGQTMMKTVLAPAFRSRALHVDGWFSTNILGNGDGRVLDDPDSLASKNATKGSVLDELLGYEVEDHVVSIHYYGPRGDNKEAWDNIDVTGFLGQKMQVKVNFLCSDSALAAPLVIELARLSELAERRGAGGVQEQFGLFFKAPMTVNGIQPEHHFHRQHERLLRWISGKDTGDRLSSIGA